MIRSTQGAAGKTRIYRFHSLCCYYFCDPSAAAEIEDELSQNMKFEYIL